VKLEILVFMSKIIIQLIDYSSSFFGLHVNWPAKSDFDIGELKRTGLTRISTAVFRPSK
jgi:hypothetical protein